MNYDGAALLKEYGLTAQEAASVPAIAGQKVGARQGRPLGTLACERAWVLRCLA